VIDVVIGLSISHFICSLFHIIFFYLGLSMQTWYNHWDVVSYDYCTLFD
jgi:hypothetical protein